LAHLVDFVSIVSLDAVVLSGRLTVLLIVNYLFCEWHYTPSTVTQ